MASLIPGYEYDIFISYRQKDNKGDRWVSEFVEALKTELESTFKEDISVYFDINPSDGLLETHDVDASLKDKLKCLVFIPIFSRTYCDPKSFAWEHEFMAFVEEASRDKFGLKVKLPNGNVASRVLPIRIHDLDNDDMKLCESVLDGVLRGIDFKYKEPGVDRPLTSDDDERKNLNKTRYRNQVNKVALAIKEIITAIKKHNQQEGEVIKAAVNAKHEGALKKNRGIKIIIISCIIVGLTVIGYFLIPEFSKSKEQLEKSIAVLPFRNDSPNDSTTYFLNGVMEEILNNLQKISNFNRVLSRTSTEQYRGSTRTSLAKIAKELKVNYIVEGSGQKYGNKLVLRVQLLVANNERHLWAKSYDREIRQTTDVISVQSEIAQLIASELKSTITPEEKHLIEKIPSTNLTAYEFYQRGREEERKYSTNDPSTKNALDKAEKMYKTALTYDSTFALGYTGLAGVYWGKHFYLEYLSENFLDSVLIFANHALSFDDHLAEAYYERASYYLVHNKTELAMKEFDEALKFNPNYWEVYYYQGGSIFLYDTKYADYVKALEYLHKAASLNHGKELPDCLRNLGIGYSLAGFHEKTRYYFHEAFNLDHDTISYYLGLGKNEIDAGNFQGGIDLLNKCFAKDSSNDEIQWELAYQYMLNGQHKESLKYCQIFTKRIKVFSQAEGMMHRIGYIYWKNGYNKESDFWFNEEKKVSEAAVKLGRYYLTGDFYNLAGINAFFGEKNKAYENLRKFDDDLIYPSWFVNLIKKDPLFSSIRNDNEFQQIVRDVESKYQAEHERVRTWLEGQGML